MTNNTGLFEELREVLDLNLYALERAVCFKPPNSSQREVENRALEQTKQALEKLDTFMAGVPDLKYSIGVLELDKNIEISKYQHVHTAAKLLHEAMEKTNDR